MARTRRAGARGSWVTPRLIRELHFYLGVFFAPAVLFFALTGGVQLLGWHEANRAGTYTPPAVVVRLSQVHIHQRFAFPPSRGKPPTAAGARTPGNDGTPAASRAAPGRTPPRLGTTLGKWFFVATAVGLSLSAVLGAWMGVTQSRRKRFAWGLLAAGALLPVLLLSL